LRFWLVSPGALKQKCLEFILLEGYFNPETFSELEYSLHNQEYPSKVLISELCRNVRCPAICEKCQADCIHKEFCKQVERLHIDRSPPCIRKAYNLGEFRIVKNYFKSLGLLPDTTEERSGVKCTFMRKVGLCETDNFCKSMKTGILTEYYNIRLKRKITEEIKSNRPQTFRK
jgi:hypothetical protein